MVGIPMTGLTGIWLIVLLVWTLPWKGYALWLAGRNNQPVLFVILLILNTLGIFEILYIFLIGRPLLKDPSSATLAKRSKIFQWVSITWALVSIIGFGLFAALI